MENIIMDEKNTRMESDILTGFFRDGVRRIDVVLVVSDSIDISKELLKVQFLLNTVKTGLQLEIEPGVMTNHSNLLFVKVHAPDIVLENYANYYNMRPFFKETRLQFMQRKKSFWEGISPCLYANTEFEVEWIKIVRSQYGAHQFSNIERSRIVYQMLINLPFGKLENEVSILRLLQNKTILDIYALHDGPYFFVQNQDMWSVNARQLLYYNWVQKRNLISLQPLNLVNEYFGGNLGVYFAFFSFYNQALLLAAIVGVFITICEIFDKTDQIIVDETCSDNTTIICPLCRRFNMCPFKRLDEYCLTATIINLIDNPFTLYYSMFVSAWAICFFGLWRRRESYWSWLWELNLVVIKWPHFKIDYRAVTRSPLTGIMKAYESRKRRTIKLALTFAVVFACIVTLFIAIGLMIMFMYWLKLMFSNKSPSAARDYFVSATYGVFIAVILLILDVACGKLSYKLTDFENHKHQYSYERSLIIKLYIFTFAFTFSILIFYSYIKGIFYTYPSDPAQWYTVLGIGMLTCSPFGCLDEVWILLSVTLIVKQIAMRFWYSVRRMRTDYNEGYIMNSKVPCWEREYRLLPVTNKVMIERYRELVTQFGSLTLFVAAFPIASAFALISNIWDIRFKARQFLLGSRRPLHPQGPGLGPWMEILLAVAYATALTNGLTIALTTKTIQRYIYIMEHKTLDGFLMSTLSVFDVNDYLNVTGPGSPAEQFQNYDNFKPERYCRYTGQRHPPSHEKKYELTGKHYKLKYYELSFVVIFEHCVFLLVFIFHYIIPAVPKDIQETLIIENRIKNMHKINKKWKK